MDDFLNETTTSIFDNLNLTSMINDGKTVFSIVRKMKSSSSILIKDLKKINRLLDDFPIRYSQIFNDYITLFSETLPCNENCSNLKVCYHIWIKLINFRSLMIILN